MMRKRTSTKGTRTIQIMRENQNGKKLSAKRKNCAQKR
jgi:hypothetical protein